MNTRSTLSALPRTSCSLFFGCCLDVMKGIESGSVDMVCADLPYGTTACKWDSVIPLDALWAEYKRVCKPDAAIVLTACQPFTTALIASNPAAFKYCWVWDKMGGGAFVIAKRRPMQTHEDILVFGSGKLTYNPQMEYAEAKNIRPSNPGSSGGNTVPVSGGVAKSAEGYDPKKRYPRTVIKMSRYGAECNSTKRVHPTQKPVALMEYLIRTYTNEGQAVLDNTMGSGTTGVACMNTGRRFIGIERDKEYFLVASERISSANVDVLARGESTTSITPKPQ